MKLDQRSVRLMGTVIDISIYHDKAAPILDEVVNRLIDYEKRFSANDTHSELMKINHQAGLMPVKVARDLYELIKLGKDHSCQQGSYLNIAIGPLVQAWRIGFSDAKVPNELTIKEKLALIRPENIILDDVAQSVFLKEKGMAIDLGALAKGYIADKVMTYLKAYGVTSALINLGGNVLTMGAALHQPDGFWRIGIQNPQAMRRGEHLMLLKVHNQSVVTSGIYERTLTYQGKTYHHIFSSETGYPIATDVASLTIVSKDSVDGEIWTTRLFGKNHKDIMETLAMTQGIEGIVVTKIGQVYMSDGIAQMKI